jgi:hypothetical protein
MPRGKKTTMAKLSREARLRERRLDKQARKDARKRQAAAGSGDGYQTAEGEPADVQPELSPDPSRPDPVGPDSP